MKTDLTNGFPLRKPTIALQAPLGCPQIDATRKEAVPKRSKAGKPITRNPHPFPRTDSPGRDNPRVRESGEDVAQAIVCHNHTHGDVCGICGYGMPTGTFDSPEFTGYCD